jgi:hypothetical protein
MLIAAVVLFAVAALFGIILATLHLKKNNAPIPLALIHGLAAAVGLILLIVFVVQIASGGLPVVALIIFIIAALGGFVLFTMHLMRKPLPRGLMFVHALAAVVAFIILLVALSHS